MLGSPGRRGTTGWLVLAVAVFARLPASRFACVIVAVAVQVSVPPGGMPAAGVGGQDTAAIRLSLIVIGAVRLILPVFVTR